MWGVAGTSRLASDLYRSGQMLSEMFGALVVGGNMMPTGGQEVACLDPAGGGDAEYGRDGARGSPRCN